MTYEPAGRHPLLNALTAGPPADVHPADTVTIERRLCDNCGTRYAKCPDGWWCVIDWRVDYLCPRCFASFTWDVTSWYVNREQRIAQHT